LIKTVVKVLTSLKLLFTVIFCIIEVKYDNFSKTVLKLVLEVKSLLITLTQA